MDLAKLLGPAVGAVVRAAVEQPIGAGTVTKPIYPEGRIRVPGRKIAGLTRGLSRKLAEKVGESLSAIREVEFFNVGEDDWYSAVEGACSTLGKLTPITATALISLDLEPDRLYRESRRIDSSRPDILAFNEAQLMAYERILRECCWQIIEFVTRQPEFERRVQLELVRRTGELTTSVKELAGTAEPELLSEFERRYKDLVVAKLDGLQLFGVTLRHSDSYSLSTAYLSLHAVPDRVGAPDATERLRVNTALADARRVLIRGEAGSGKTTLLQWLAVNSARSPEKLPAGWGPAVPFLLPLRRYSMHDLPRPDQFPREVAPALSSEAPSGWTSTLLRNGRALVLIDGVDELPPARRGDVWIWLHDLVTTYPKATYVITSRPPAVDAKVLVPDDFEPFMLLPMGAADVRAFVGQWHAAMKDAKGDDRSLIATYETELLDKLGRRRDLRRLATNPLLCALICALHLERYKQLPQDRMGLYRAALEMLLIRRDEARGITADKVAISQEDQESLLGQLAYWLVRNGWSDSDKSEAGRRLARYMKAMPYVTARPSDVLEFLLLRSGVLREPVLGTIDFLHKTFQEYLAAKALLDDGDIDVMLRHAEQDNWREVIVMAVGHARRSEREKIIRGLLDRGGQIEELRRRLYLIAVSCLEHTGALDPNLVSEVREKASRLVVPEDRRQVDLIAAAGEVVLDVIPEPKSLTDNEGLLLIDVINRFDLEDSLPVLSRMAAVQSRAIRAKLAASWPAAAVESYGASVLDPMRLDDVTVHIRGERQERAAANLSRLTNALIQDYEGTLNHFNRHSSLQTMILCRVRLDSLHGLSDCSALRSVIILDSEIRQTLEGLADREIQELAILGAKQPEAARSYLLHIGTFGSLRRLTVDQALMKNGSLGLHTETSVDRLDFLSAGWMASCVDHVYRKSAWAAMTSGNRPQNWIRNSLSSLGDLSGVRELSLSGWPTPAELHTIRSMPKLETLRLVVADDELRDVVGASGLEYGYPAVDSGFLRTLQGTPALRRLEVDLLTLDRVSSPRWQETRKSYKVVQLHGSELPIQVQEMTAIVPRRCRTEISVNGLMIFHPWHRIGTMTES